MFDELVADYKKQKLLWKNECLQAYEFELAYDAFILSGESVADSLDKSTHIITGEFSNNFINIREELKQKMKENFSCYENVDLIMGSVDVVDLFVYSYGN